MYQCIASAGRGCIFLSKLHLEEKKSQTVSEIVPVLWLFKTDFCSGEQSSLVSADY